MADVIDFLDRTQGEFDKYVVFFMTDGEADYPNYEITQLLGKSYIGQVKFNAVAYGDADSTIIERIGNAFPG